LIEILLEFGKLKNVPRTGWLLRGVNRLAVESVAEHVARTAFIAMILCDTLASKGIKLDNYKVIEMALLHDISEAKLLDIDRDVSSLLGGDFKEKAEKKIEDLTLSKLDSTLRERYSSLLSEYHDCESLEAEVVKTSDKLETLIQASEYEESGIPKKKLKDFWKKEKILTETKDSMIKDILAEVIGDLQRKRSE